MNRWSRLFRYLSFLPAAWHERRVLCRYAAQSGLEPIPILLRRRLRPLRYHLRNLWDLLRGRRLVHWDCRFTPAQIKEAAAYRAAAFDAWKRDRWLPW